jgi:type II secretory pathway predicted ATPase ExeA
MGPDQTYYEYWGLARPPFDNVPDPAMYFNMHASVENAVGEILFAIEEGNDCLAVIVGDVGLGKTMTLRVIVDSLDLAQYRLAFVTNPDMTFIQLMKEIVGQLTGEPCTENTREKILGMFHHLLVQTHEDRRKVLIFIDEANVIRPGYLESLRLLTNMQSTNENLLTLVLAGQLDLAQRLEEPERANLFQRIGVYCRINKIESRAIMQDYIEHRLARAGVTRRLFTDTAYDAIWEVSEYGVPRLINKFAKLALKAGQGQSAERINKAIVQHIGARFQRQEVPRTSDEDTPVEVVVSVERDQPEVVPSAEPVVVPAKKSAKEMSTKVVEFTASALKNAQTDTLAAMVKFPEHIYQTAETLSAAQRNKLAGKLATELLRKHPKLIRHIASQCDTKPAWSTLRRVVLQKLKDHTAASLATTD